MKHRPPILSECYRKIAETKGEDTAKRLLETKHEIESFAWSPDGKQIAFLASEPKTDAEDKKEKDKDDARVVDRDDRLRRVWLLDPETGKTRQVTSGRWRIAEAEWLPGGNKMIVVATDHPESDVETDRIVAAAFLDAVSDATNVFAFEKKIAL